MIIAISQHWGIGREIFILMDLNGLFKKFDWSRIGVEQEKRKVEQEKRKMKQENRKMKQEKRRN